MFPKLQCQWIEPYIFPTEDDPRPVREYHCKRCGRLVITHQPPIRATCRYQKLFPWRILAFLRACGRWAKSGFFRANKKTRARRLAECESCPLLDGRTCKGCGCNVDWKTRMATEVCPVGKWHKAGIGQRRLFPEF